MPPANPLQTMFGDLFFAGMRVFESPLLEAKPKLKLSPSCPVSDKFRAEMDAWLLEIFGVDIDDDGLIAIRMPSGIHMAPSILRALRDHTKEP